MLFNVPLTDTSEARYAEMARKMLVSGDWVMPQFSEGVAFMGKPPLYVWLSAAGMKLFGIDEFGSRIGIFLAGMAMLAVIYFWLKKLKGEDYALLASFIILSTSAIYISIGCVLADSVLWIGTTLSMIAAWNLCSNENKSSLTQGLLFFSGLAIGLLAKGPVAVVLTGLSLFFWLTWQRKWKVFCKRLPWVRGSCLLAVTVIPWYVMAEIHTPGFLRYFLWGEHVLRYLDSGWDGDLYGNAHSEVLGTIWVYALVSFLPWSFMLLPALRHPRKLWSQLPHNQRAWVSYLICWGLSPMLFFTFATNVLPAYILPALPALGILVIEIHLHPTRQPLVTPLRRKIFYGASAVAGMLYLYIYVSMSFTVDLANKKSHKWIVNRIHREQRGESYNLNVWRYRYYSAEFYNGGNVTRLNDLSDFQSISGNHEKDYLSIRKSALKELPPSIINRFKFLGVYRNDLLFVEYNDREIARQSSYRLRLL